MCVCTDQGLPRCLGSELTPPLSCCFSVQGSAGARGDVGPEGLKGAKVRLRLAWLEGTSVEH